TPRMHLTAQLRAAATRTMPVAIRNAIDADLQNLRLSRFIPHPTVADSEITGKRNLELKISTTSGTQFQIDNKSYDPNRIDQLLSLGSTEEWTLTSYTSPPVGHPFHIHVNPFQIVSILDRNGIDVSTTGETADPQYANLKSVWKDTIFVKPGYEVVIRTRYRRYIGDF